MREADPAPPGFSGKLLKVFPAFANRNFRRYFPGQVVSMVGTWVQMVAQGWLVLEISGSAFDVGLTAAASSVPPLFLSLPAGVLVDRYSRRTILFWTQASAMLLAFILAIFTLTGQATIPVILVLSFLLGCVNALNVPALQAFLGEMVEGERIASAVALNSGIYNVSRVIGPAIAGFIIAVAGSGIAFLLNGFSFLAVLLSLFTIRLDPPAHDGEHQHPLRAIGEGLAYAWEHPIIRTMVAIIAVVSIFAWSYVSMLPVIAKRSFGMDATGLGWLYGVSGIGSVVANILVSMYSGRVVQLRVVAGGLLLFSLSLLAFTWTASLWLAFFWLFLCGFGLVGAVSTMSGTIQSHVEGRFRGRVMSLYMMVFMGFMPIGNLEVGWLAEAFGVNPAIRLGAAATLLAGAGLILYAPRVLREHRRYLKRSS